MKEIILSRGFVALVDDEDFDWLSQWNWYADKDGYAIRDLRNNDGVKTTLKMHKELIFKYQLDIEECDHADGVRANNQKNNFRKSSKSQNQWNKKIQINNTSGYKGVHFNKRTKKWIAKFKINRKTIHVGSFNSPEEAFFARRLDILKAHGAFANDGTGCEILKDKKC